MINQRLRNLHLILASRSPRRQYLLKELGLDFEISYPEVEEVFPQNLTPVETAVYLAELKAANFDGSRMRSDTVLITADTIVTLDSEILGKPAHYEEAIEMLKKLSGRKHDVITAVCLKTRKGYQTFHVTSSVYFKKLTDDEIVYYVDNFQPFDKAGGYGIQEWIGYIGINRIEGSFFNVMGLPIKELYEALLEYTMKPL